MSVEKLPIGLLLIYFVAYLVVHIVIGVCLKKAKEEYETNQESEELRKKFKVWNGVFRWFPFVYVVFVIFALYQL